jgi:hypothetical protein
MALLRNWHFQLSDWSLYHKRSLSRVYMGQNHEQDKHNNQLHSERTQGDVYNTQTKLLVFCRGFS